MQIQNGGHVDKKIGHGLIFAVMTAVLAAVLLTACAGGETLYVSSSVFKLADTLKDDDFDFKYAEKMRDPTKAVTLRDYYISVKDDRLLITDADPLGGEVMSVDCGTGLFVGTREGISYLPAEGVALPVTAEPCIALWRRDGGCMAVVTAGGMTKLLLIDRPDAGGSPRAITAATRYGSAVAAAPTADGTGMLAVIRGESTALLQLAQDGRITTLSEDAILQAIDVRSITTLRGRIYCASPIGIFEFTPDTEGVRWYPLEID